ncbi:MAG: type II toxin-antitoxin system Phd/YefM family antitoxin [Chloroflexi bacterium]|nr:type II toxin-antitoxin system Phd/YefM family antitoxin [Chloroflexota bacterium]
MSNKIKEGTVNKTATTDLEQPVILERKGEAVAVLMSVAEYDRYQIVLQSQEQLSAAAARRAADKAIFQDLVGCALSSGEPMFAAAPHPHWRVPYRFLGDNALVAIIEVNAQTGAVVLTNAERDQILAQVEQLTRQHAQAA